MQVTVHRIPARQNRIFGGLTQAMRTGIRCTVSSNCPCIVRWISEKLLPVPPEKLSTRPSTLRPGYGVHGDGLPAGRISCDPPASP